MIRIENHKIYYILMRKIYAVGIRPKPGTTFYSKVLHDEYILMKGR